RSTTAWTARTSCASPWTCPTPRPASMPRAGCWPRFDPMARRAGLEPPFLQQCGHRDRTRPADTRSQVTGPGPSDRIAAFARPEPPMSQPLAYRRVLLKLSGEALMGDEDYGI